MPERDRRHQSSDVYAENTRRDRSYSPNGHGLRSHNQKPRRTDRGGSAGDRRDTDQGPPAHRDHNHEGSSRLSRETSEFHPEVERYDRPHRQALYNLKYVLTSRGLCQLMELSVNLLLVICAGVPYSNSSTYRDVASLGGLYYYYYGGANAFTGAEAEKVKALDQQFYQLKQPPYVYTMACGGALMVYACAMFALGIFRVTYRWPPVLLGEALLNLLIGLGYIPALAFYFIKVQEVYSNPICAEREQMYSSKGLKGFGCQLDGADIAGGLFGVLGVFVFMFGAALAVRAFRSVRELKKQRTNEDDHL